MTVPGIGFVLGYTIAAEIGDITRFASAQKLVGYTGLCGSESWRFRHGLARKTTKTT